MSWLIVAIAAYLVLAVVFLIDKHLLGNGIPNPTLYVFYNGIFSILIFVLAPFVDFHFPGLGLFFLAFLTGAIFMVALFWLYRALFIFDASRVVPIVGALSPIFSFVLIFLFTGIEEDIHFWRALAFSILVFGSFFAVFEKTRTSIKSFLFSSLAAFFFALFFILQKNVFESFGSFWNALIWMSIGSFFIAILVFLLSAEARKKIFSGRKILDKKTALLFIFNKSFSSFGGFLQRVAIFLTPGFIEVPLVQSLQGIQYIFLFLLATFLSRKFPLIIKEKISKKIIIQKTVAIILISLGLIILIISD